MVDDIAEYREVVGGLSERIGTGRKAILVESMESDSPARLLVSVF